MSDTIEDQVQVQVQDSIITIKGWIRNVRDRKKVAFLQVYRKLVPWPYLHGKPECKNMLQVVLSGPLLEHHRPDLTMGAAVRITGKLVKSEKSPTWGHELQATEFHLYGKGTDTVKSEINTNSDVATQLKKRHLLHWYPMIDPTAQACTRVKDAVERAAYGYYHRHGFTKVSPPSIVDVQTEGGSTLFKVDYYGTERYLTQSGQLYLESVLPGYGDVWCYESSFRAEGSRTPRHLAEFKHLEAELCFITFDDLKEHVESIVTCLLSHAGVTDVPKFHVLTHKEAVHLLNGLKYLDPTGKEYTYDSDLNDSAEMRILAHYEEEHGRPTPVFITEFPASLKSFYMKRLIVPGDDHVYTESFDLLLPGVGEVVGGSMRITDYDELMSAFAREDIDPQHYTWYTDTRRIGSCPHGGYGIGMERLIKAAFYMMDDPIPHVRDVCLYPQY